MTYDYCVVGGGIVGLSTAMILLQRRPGASLLLLEKEDEIARHQTGHNSGVIHAGIYYLPGSLKAELCRRGAETTKEFCRAHAIPFEVCGKLIVATNPAEVGRLSGLIERAKANKIKFEILDGCELRRWEPNVSGLKALFIESTGIVDYRAVARSMATVIKQLGGEIVTSARVSAIAEHAADVLVQCGERRWSTRQLVVCGGSQSDRLARLAGLDVNYQIVPFRGEYYRLPATRNTIVKRLIYPVPDPELPFLGIHLTKMVDGGVSVGPNAVLGLSREGYRKFSFSLRDVAEFTRFRGFWSMLRTHFRSGIAEMRNSLLKRSYLKECRKYCPSLTAGDLLPLEAGIRAQAVGHNGELIHDFLFKRTERMLHVCNAPSPAATAAIPIGQMITDECFRSGKAETFARFQL